MPKSFGIPKRARRDDNEEAIVDRLLQLGATVEFLSIEDVPDLLVGFCGVTYLIEVKEPGKNLRKGQAEWHDAWQGGAPIVIRSEQEAIDFLLAIRERVMQAAPHPCVWGES